MPENQTVSIVIQAGTAQKPPTPTVSIVIQAGNALFLAMRSAETHDAQLGPGVAKCAQPCPLLSKLEQSGFSRPRGGGCCKFATPPCLQHCLQHPPALRGMAESDIIYVFTLRQAKDTR